MYCFSAPYIDVANLSCLSISQYPIHRLLAFCPLGHSLILLLRNGGESFWSRYQRSHMIMGKDEEKSLEPIFWSYIPGGNLQLPAPIGWCLVD